MATSRVHIMRLAVQDWRTSRVRARSVRLGDPMLRLVYLEALFALHEAGGALPSDPEVLADELQLPAEDIARALPILDELARRPGARGGLLREGDRIQNARITDDLAQARTFIAGQREHGRRSAEVRRSKDGSAQPRRPPPQPEAIPWVASEDTEGSFGENGGSPEPAVAVAVAGAVASAEPVPDNAPPDPPAFAGEHGAGGGLRPGDTSPATGTTILDVDAHGPVVVQKGPKLAPSSVAEAVGRLVADGGRLLGLRFERADRRRLRERLLSGESEAHIRERWERTAAVLEALDSEAEGADEEAAALRLLEPPAAPPPRLMPSSTVAIVHNDRRTA